MDLGIILGRLRKECGLSQTQTADFLTSHGCCVTYRAVSKWEKGDTQPNAEQLILLCDLYNVRDVLSVFMGKQSLFANLNDVGIKRLKEYARLLEASEEFSKFEHKHTTSIARTIPLYDLPVSAGTGQFLDSSSYELLDIDETVPLSATFAVRISGDSMTPRFVDRQIIYIKQQQNLDKGEIGIFILNGNAYCKMLSGENNFVELVSINSKYKPIAINEYDEFRVLGKVVG